MSPAGQVGLVVRGDATPAIRAIEGIGRAFRRLADALAALVRRLRARREARETLQDRLLRAGRLRARRRARAVVRSQRNTDAGPRRRKHGRATR